jgi:hypothetical protein
MVDVPLITMGAIFLSTRYWAEVMNFVDPFGKREYLAFKLTNMHRNQNLQQQQRIYIG